MTMQSEVIIWLFTFWLIWYVLIKDKGQGEAKYNYLGLGNSLYVLNALAGAWIIDAPMTFLVLILTIINWVNDLPKYTE